MIENPADLCFFYRFARLVLVSMIPVLMSALLPPFNFTIPYFWNGFFQMILVKPGSVRQGYILADLLILKKSRAIFPLQYLVKT